MPFVAWALHSGVGHDSSQVDMKRFPLLIALASFAVGHTAFAQATRTWVSGVGDDANPCSRTAPGKTFAGAISKTAANGVISVLDPGGFGAVTITKSITIDGGGFEGSILGSATNGIVINAAATDVVVLRNLQIEGAGTGLVGVKILSAGAVYLENCRIKGFATGVSDTTTAVTGIQVVINDCFIHECGTAGVTLTPGSGAATAAKFAHTRIEGCGVGLVVSPGAAAYLTESTVAFNVGVGLSRTGNGLIYSFGNNKVFGNSPNGQANKKLKMD